MPGGPRRQRSLATDRVEADNRARLVECRRHDAYGRALGLPTTRHDDIEGLHSDTTNEASQHGRSRSPTRPGRQGRLLIGVINARSRARTDTAQPLYFPDVSPLKPDQPRWATVRLGDSDTSDDRREDDAADDSDADPPASVGRYRVAGVLGSGGMGIVYRGFDQTLRRPVAVKVISAARPRSSSARARLIREAQALAAFSHPNVVAVYEVGEFDGAVFIAMELVEGITLARWVEIEDHTWQEVVEMYVRAGRGLEHAHIKGLVHRDFKPANVLVGDDGRPRVLDFGLATVDRDGTSSAEAEADELDVASFTEPLTVTGAVMGTPAYMAPEQAAGRDATPKSDQFSFAVALWEALTGVRPFPGETMLDLQESIRTGRRRPPPSEAAVPPTVLRVLDRALEAAPRNRWPHLGMLLDALEETLTRPRRAPWLLMGIGAVGLLAAGFAAFDDVEERCDGPAEWSDAWGPQQHAALAAAFAGRAGETEQRVRKMLDGYGERWVEIYESTCEAPSHDATFDRRIHCLRQRRDAVRGTVAVLLDGDTTTLDRGVLILEGIEQPEDCSQGALDSPSHAVPRDPALAAEVSILRADVSAARALLIAGKYEDAAASILATHREATAVGFEPLINEAQLVRGLTHSRMGQAKVAQEQLTQAFWGATDLGDDVVAAEAAIELAWQVGYMQARYPEGVEWARHFESAQLRRGKDPTDDASLVLGPIYFDWDKLDLALPHLRRALASALARGDAHGIGIAHLNLGALYYELGMAQLARDEFVAARGELDAALPESQADRVLLDINHGGMELDLAQDVETARPLIERAHETALEFLGPEHPVTGLAFLKFGELQSLLGDLDAARAALARARDVAAVQQSVTDTLTIDSALALALHRAGRLDESEAQWRRIATEAEAALGPQHTIAAAAQFGLGQIAEARGDLEGAQVRYEDALSDIGANARADALILRLSQIGVLRKLGHAEDALQRAREAVAWATQTYGADSPQALQAQVELAYLEAATDRDASIATLESLTGPDHDGRALRSARAHGWARLGLLLKDTDPDRAEELLRDANALLGPALHPFQRAELSPP